MYSTDPVSMCTPVSIPITCTLVVVNVPVSGKDTIGRLTPLQI
jgi:hypothetical protein